MYPLRSFAQGIWSVCNVVNTRAYDIAHVCENKFTQIFEGKREIEESSIKRFRKSWAPLPPKKPISKNKKKLGIRCKSIQKKQSKTPQKPKLHTVDLRSENECPPIPKNLAPLSPRESIPRGKKTPNLDYKAIHNGQSTTPKKPKPHAFDLKGENECPPIPKKQNFNSKAIQKKQSTTPKKPKPHAFDLKGENECPPGRTLKSLYKLPEINLNSFKFKFCDEDKYPPHANVDCLYSDGVKSFIEHKKKDVHSNDVTFLEEVNLPSSRKELLQKAIMKARDETTTIKKLKQHAQNKIKAEKILDETSPLYNQRRTVAKQDIAENEFITLYNGFLLTKEEFDKERGDMSTFEEYLSLVYLIVIPELEFTHDTIKKKQTFYILGHTLLDDKIGWPYINDSTGSGKTNNVVPYTFIYKGIPGIAIMAQQPIRKGEELFLSYGDHYWYYLTKPQKEFAENVLKKITFNKNTTLLETLKNLLYALWPY